MHVQCVKERRTAEESQRAREEAGAVIIVGVAGLAGRKERVEKKEGGLCAEMMRLESAGI